MENWGLVTYRESALLANGSSSASDRQRVTVVVAHELAHFWCVVVFYDDGCACVCAIGLSYCGY